MLVNFKKLFTVATLASSALVASGSVYANDVVDAPTFSGLTSTFNAYHTAGAFTDTFTFTLPNITSSNVSVVTIGAGVADIDFYSGSLNGQALTLTTDGSGFVELLYSPSTFSVTGPLSLIVTGFSGSNASYSGTLNVTTVPAVPEPATVALMLAGLGAVGFIARRRNSKV